MSMLSDEKAPELLTATLGPAPDSRRPAPWHVVLLSALLVLMIGIGGMAVAQRAGDSKESRVSIGFLAAAQAKTVQVNDFRIAMTIKMNMSGQHLTEHMDGELSAKPSRLSLGMDIPDFGRLDERVVGSTLYVHSDTSNVHGKHWLSYSVPAGSTSSFGTADPLSTLRSLTGAKGKVVRAGRKTIDGVRTTHYKASLDPQAILDKLPSEARQALGSSSEALAAIGNIPIEIYIADDNTVRRLTEKLSMPGAKMQLEMNITPLGRPAHVVAPSAKDVARETSFTQLFADLGLSDSLG